MLFELDGLRVTADGECFVADSAAVIGAVVLRANSSVWYNAVIRGDREPIVVGEGSNIQDGAVLHTDIGYPLVIGNRVTVGHGVMLHGCTIGDNSLIGINAVVLNGATIGKNCLVGANALVTEGKDIPDNSLVLGSPGKVARVLTPEQIEELTEDAQTYVDNARRYLTSLKPQATLDQHKDKGTQS